MARAAYRIFGAGGRTGLAPGPVNWRTSKGPSRAFFVALRPTPRARGTSGPGLRMERPDVETDDRRGNGRRGAQGPGRRARVRLSRRRGAADLRRAVPPEPGCATSWCATSRARRTRPKATPARPARSACVLVTSGPGATNAVTGLTDALMDSIPLVVHHRPGADPPDRLRRLPGMRHGRHHPPLHQAQLPGAARRGPAAHPARGLLHRHHRPAGPGGGRHPQGRAVRHGDLRRPRRNIQHKTYGRSQGRPGADRARRWR